ncbi:ABC transporter ATP-binding protein [Pigmentiphaga sp. GD03639]|uniref:ABC transporter ATP-binding protein n=1 Tax=Pigmentiphaga sp. GD03639 TaxID=2975354 RepID=UPI0024495D0B|nr:ABC transporter ATP-binding protein [Pigmentiphaga sp. GD03639]MDH2236626.1 ABC transporter ATP-binding protein [Pigmentiphaga sp. GD03639]
MNPGAPLLELQGVVAGYGPVTVLNGLGMAVEAGSLTALLGRNGVGKSTTLKAIMGLAQVKAGRILFEGRDITRCRPDERAGLGLGYVPQTRDIFPSLSVEENLVAGLKRFPAGDLDQAYALFPRLRERRRNRGNQLSGGEQQMLSVARALLGRPRLLLLDEPLEGLAPVICQELLAAFRRLAAQGGPTMLIVEQQVQEVLAFARQGVILERGSVVHQGDCAQLRTRDDILDRYLGMAVA